MAYVNPQLHDQTVDMVLLLKEWMVDNASEIIQTESYSDKPCGCQYNKIILASKYISIMECYVFADDKTIDPYNCLTEDELRTVIQKSKKITVGDC